MTLKKFGKFILIFVLSFSWIFGGWSQVVRALTTGPNFPISGVNDASIGVTTWTNPGNITASENTRATVTLAKNSGVSQAIKVTGFGFNIPLDAQIDGITVEWETSENGDAAAGGIKDNAIRIVKAGTIGATDLSNAIFWVAPASEAFVSYGGATNLWGETWTASDINDANFGVAISAQNVKVSGGGAIESANVDAVRITINYTIPTYEQSAYRFFDNANSTDVGSALAVQDTSATLVSTGDAFRLRMLLHIAAAQLNQSGQNFKLQFATKSGTCDTGFSGETYADVTGATAVAYNNNSTPADGDNLTGNANDPTHGGDTVVNQDYEEANNFTNTVAAIPAGQDGKWDFSLIDNGAPASTSYCFRIRKSDDTNIDTYTVIPEITTSSGIAPPTLTFSISDNSIGFGTLSPADDFFANGAGTGSATEVEAHTISASTNGSSGYTITVNGTTLTSGGNTVSAIGGTNTTSSAGTEQFGLRMTASGGNGAVSSPYAAAGFAFDTSAFPDPVASDADGDDITTTYSARYIGNISTLTEAGSYSATLTYVITASF